MSAPVVVGLDLSLTSTGVAISGGGAVTADTIKPPRGLDGLARLRYLRGVVGYAVRDADLVVVETLALSSRTGKALERAGFWWAVRDEIDHLGIPFLGRTPQQVKMFATGKGNTLKDEVLAAMIKRYMEIEIKGNDAADALALCGIGLHHLGHSLGTGLLPKTHLRALDKIEVEPPLGAP